jgi:hypothetical protein
MYGYCVILHLLLGQRRHLLRFLIRIQLIIMCDQLIHVPWTLTSHHIEWRTGIEDSAIVRIYKSTGSDNVLWKLQIDMRAPFRALKQVPVKRRLLYHGSMQSIPRSPFLLVVRITIDELREAWQLSICSCSRHRIDSERYGKGCKDEVEGSLQYQQERNSFQRIH